MNIMNMMWFMGMCLLSTVIIGGFFIHRYNNRNAAANKKGQSSKEGLTIYFIIKTIYG